MKYRPPGIFGRFFFLTTGEIVLVFTYPGSLRLVWKDARVRGLAAPLLPHDRRYTCWPTLLNIGRNNGQPDKGHGLHSWQSFVFQLESLLPCLPRGGLSSS